MVSLKDLLYFIGAILWILALTGLVRNIIRRRRIRKLIQEEKELNAELNAERDRLLYELDQLKKDHEARTKAQIIAMAEAEARRRQANNTPTSDGWVRSEHTQREYEIERWNRMNGYPSEPPKKKKDKVRFHVDRQIANLTSWENAFIDKVNRETKFDDAIDKHAEDIPYEELKPKPNSDQDQKQIS